MSTLKNPYTTKVEGLKVSQVKALYTTAKTLGFKAYRMPYMAHGCPQPGLSNFVVDWSSFDGTLPDKLAAQQKMKAAMREARLNFFDAE